VLIPSLDNANFAATVAGLNAGLTAQGLQILLCHTNYD
jgi:LacI family gluconate utilization system Gnt-I transcriptional repressor